MKEQQKIANQRKDFEHKLFRKIADSCKLYICEDLNIRGILKNRHLAKQISSVGWNQFNTVLKYKLERKGGIFLKVSRWLPSSQTCSCCGYKSPTVKDLKIRAWTCPNCHTYHDRDENAMLNIWNTGVDWLKASGVKGIDGQTQAA